MVESSLAPRLRRLAAVAALGREVRVATTFRARLLGLAWLDLDQVGEGLLIPRCSSVHTFGMRFPLDIYFLQEGGEPFAVRRKIAPHRVVSCRRARAVLEIPSAKGGEFCALRP